MNWDSDKTYKLIGGILFLAGVWYFTEIVIYLIIASIIGVALQPLMKLLSKIKIRKKPISRTISAAISLIVFLILINGILVILIPAINSQASDIAKVDFTSISQQLDVASKDIEGGLRRIGILQRDEQLEKQIVKNLSGLIKEIQFNNIFGNLIAMTGSVLMAVFSILFMSFFFIKDDDLFQRIVLLFVPEKNIRKVSEILSKINKMLSRYFLGIVIEVSSMMLLITIGGLILGLKNALLIGFIGGLMNLIPYIGPLIGASIGSVLVAMTNLYLGFEYTLALIGGTLVVFAVANMIDNFLLQPIIYSNSVNAHPIEIFIVIIMAGKIGGPLAMIAAIPIYTVIRITAKEFLGEKVFIKRLMKDL
jgi:predicted PurR-regulated permease PerM